MSYYMGDFYRGDFYRGDPGIGSFFRRAAGFVSGFLPGGHVIQGITGKVMLPAVGQARMGTLAKLGGMVGQVGKVVRGHPVLSAAGAAGVIGAVGAGAERLAAGPGAMKGFHISKRTGKLVRNRHMRPTNVKALRRSLRRIHSFSRIARRVIHITHPRRGAAVRFKFRRRKKA